MDLEKQKGCSSGAAVSSASVRSNRKRKISKGFDAEIERPHKRHGSSQSSESSPEYQPLAIASRYHSIRTTSSSLTATDKSASIHSKNSKQISNEGKLGESSSSAANSQRDSQTMYSSSFKKKVNSKSNKLMPVEDASSPADSVSTNEISEDLDFDYTSADLIQFVDSPPDEYSEVFSPLEPRRQDVTIINKGDKTPHALKRRPTTLISYKTQIDDDAIPCYVTPVAEQRLCPLPKLPWASREELWINMVRKDEAASIERDVNMFDRHPSLNSRMRAILLDWLIEVCEVYKLHRETFFLTVDYIDRYLTIKENISKNQLQLIGITCLFIAAKVEEIYPPKVHEFAYVTDSACSDDDILTQEALIMQTLNWCVTPVTVMGWLSIYMQLNDTTGKTDSTGINPEELLLLNSSKWSRSFIYPQFSGMNFARTAQLLDLCSLDVEMANFPYSIVAAAAVGHVLGRNVASRVSGLSWSAIAPCAKWMEPYYQILEEEADEKPLMLQEMNEQVDYNYAVTHVCPNLNKDIMSILQTHSTSLETFDKALLRREQLELAESMTQQEASPAQPTIQVCPPGILTPPASNRKSIESQTD